MDLTNCITIVKFFKNPVADKLEANEVITRTTKKIGVVSKKADNRTGVQKPKDSEFWKVAIVNEIHQGKPEGCLILEPICFVDATDIVRLLPGMYEEKRDNGVLVIFPKKDEHNWILPLKHKQSIEVHTIVISLSSCY